MPLRKEWKGDYVSRTFRARAAAGLLEAGKQARAFAQSIAPVDTGEFRDSIQVTVDAQRLRVILYSGVEHSKYLEFGTRFMAPRPTFRRTLDQWGPTFIDVVIASMGT